MLRRLPPCVLLGAVAPFLRWHELRSLHRAGAAICGSARSRAVERRARGRARRAAGSRAPSQGRRRDPVPSLARRRAAAPSSPRAAPAARGGSTRAARLAAADGDDAARRRWRPRGRGARGPARHTRAKTLRALRALGAGPSARARRLVGAPRGGCRPCCTRPRRGRSAPAPRGRARGRARRPAARACTSRRPASATRSRSRAARGGRGRRRAQLRAQTASSRGRKFDSRPCSPRGTATAGAPGGGQGGR